jgi:predicted patatin/cPLA2 family phospholipase
MKTGLVLEGGGMRGLYTTGVLDRLMDEQITFDYVIGVSAGACNAVSYLSGQRGRSYRINTRYIGDKRYAGLENLIKTRSVFGMDFLFDTIPNELDPFDYEAFFASPCEFFCVATDVETGRPAYFGRQDIRRGGTAVLRASSSIPCFSPVVEYNRRFYLDGGASDPIPVRRAFSDGCDRVVALLTRPRDYRKRSEPLRALYRRLYRDHPAMVGLLDRRHLLYNRTLDDIAALEREGRVLVIAPEKALEVGRFEKNPARLRAAAWQGYRDARNMQGTICRFLSR